MGRGPWAGAQGSRVRAGPRLRADGPFGGSLRLLRIRGISRRTSPRGGGRLFLALQSASARVRRSAIIGRGTALPFQSPRDVADPGRRRLFESELDRLGRFLIGIGGRAPRQGELEALISQSDERRARLLSAAAQLPARQFAEAVARFHWDGEVRLPGEAATGGEVGEDAGRWGRGLTVEPGAVPIVLVGGPLPRGQWRLLDALEVAGASVVLNATESGERGLPADSHDPRDGTAPGPMLARRRSGRVPAAQLPSLCLAGGADSGPASAWDCPLGLRRLRPVARGGSILARGLRSAGAVVGCRRGRQWLAALCNSVPTTVSTKQAVSCNSFHMNPDLNLSEITKLLLISPSLRTTLDADRLVCLTQPLKFFRDQPPHIHIACCQVMKVAYFRAGRSGLPLRGRRRQLLCGPKGLCGGLGSRVQAARQGLMPRG